MHTSGPDPAPSLGRTRNRVREELAARTDPVAVTDLAGLLGLHVNSVRFHLEALVGAGLAERMTEPRSRAGRPRVLYRASPDAPAAGQRSYRLLAEILAGHVAAHSRAPAQAAVGAGCEWGRSLATRPAPFTRVSAGQATQALTDVLGEIGFAPEVTGSTRNRRILLNHCPFREVAATNPQVVCSIHLGLAQGLLDGMDAPLTAERLEPWVTPTQCAIALSRRAAG